MGTLELQRRLGGAVPVLAGLLLAASSCSWPWSGNSTPPSPPRASVPATATPSPAPSLPATVWVLAPNGLRLHSDPDRKSDFDTVAQASQLAVVGSRTVGQETWIQVTGKGSAKGWVLLDPSLVTTEPVQQYSNTANQYSLLYPKSWLTQEQSPSTTVFNGTGRGHAERLTVQVSDDQGHLMPIPPGRKIRESGPLELCCAEHGMTVFIQIYRMDGGGLAMDVEVKWAEQRWFLFLFQELDTQDEDLATFTTLLDSVSITG